LIPIGSTTTAADGSYAFGPNETGDAMVCLDPDGMYSVEISGIPSGYTNTTGAGTGCAGDNDDSPANDGTSMCMDPSGPNADHIDFGIVPEGFYDLALIKTVVTSGPYEAGQDVTYTITVFNQGTIDASNIEITDVIPAGMTLSSASSGWTGPAGGPVTTTIVGPILAGTSFSVDIILTIDPDFESGALVNNAEISNDDGDDNDSQPGDSSQPNDFEDNDDPNETDGGDDEDPEVIEVGTCPALVCNDNLQISVGLECYVALTPDMLLEAPTNSGNYDILVYDEHGEFIGDTIRGVHTGQILKYKVVSKCDGNSCWGEINFEANILPQIFSSCPYTPGDMDMKSGVFSSGDRTVILSIDKTDDCQQSLIIESLTALKYTPGNQIWELSGVDWEVLNSANDVVLSGSLGSEGDSDIEDISSLPIGTYDIVFTGIEPSALGDYKFSVSVPSCQVAEECEGWCGGGAPEGFITLQEAYDLVNNGCAAQIMGEIIVDESVTGDMCDPDGSIRVVTYTARIEMHGVISKVVLATQAYSQEKLDIRPGVGNTVLLFPKDEIYNCDEDMIIDSDLEFGSPAYIEALTGSGAAAYPSFIDKHADPVPDTIFRDSIVHVVDILDTVEVMSQQLVTDKDGNSSLEWVLLSVVDKTLRDSIVPDTFIPGTFSQPLVPIRERVCNLLTTYSDLVFSSCAGGQKIVREWVVIDWCSSDVRQTDYQNIEISDQTEPVVQTPDAKIISTDPWTCSGKVKLPELKIDDNCSTKFTTTWSTSEGRIVEDYALDLWPTGDTIHITALVQDECGNGTQTTMPVFVEDKVPPVMVCASAIQVTLTYDSTSEDFNGGVAKVDVSSFDDGSNDAGCGDVTLQVVRMEDWTEAQLDCNGRVVGYKPNSCLAQTRTVDLGGPTFKNDCVYDESNEGQVTALGDYVKFCCEDAGQIVRVLVIGTDKNGNSNICMVEVNVIDKSGATMICDAATIACAGNMHEVPGPRMLGGACEGEHEFIMLSEENSSGTACGAGTMIREYFIDSNGDGVISTGDPYCQQLITIQEGSGKLDPLTIKWPKHHDGTVVQGVNLECNEDGDIETLERHDVKMGGVVTCVPDDTGDEPTWCDTDCGLVGYSVEVDSIFVSDACLKIIKRWSVVDWCTYDPNGNGIDDDNDSGADQFQAVEDWAQGECSDCANGYSSSHTDPVYFRYTKYDDDGYYTYDQVIKVIDDSAPVIDGPSEYVVNTSGGATTKDDPTECTGAEGITATAEDFCGGSMSGSSKLQWIITVSKDGEVVASKTVKGSSATMSSQEGSPGDVHIIRWKVQDGCGNFAVAETTVTFGDETPPTPFCVGGLTTTYMQSNGCVEVWAKDFDFGSFDNCTDTDDLRYSVVPETTAPIAPGQPGFDEQAVIRFCCSDMTSYIGLDIWVWDSSGNGDFCNVGILLDDNSNVCPEDGGDVPVEGEGENPNTGEENEGAKAMIAGQITTEDGSMVDNTMLTLNSILPEHPKSQMNSDVDGTYAFENNVLAYDYSVKAFKDGNDANGVSTLDLVLISRHILGLADLSSPYKVIAADANNDERVSTVDLVTIKRLVLGLDEELANTDSWVFADPEFSFIDNNNPWPFMDQQMVIDLNEDMMSEDFIAIKIGDVTGDAAPNSFTKSETRSSGLLTLAVEDRLVSAGEEVRMEVSANQFNDFFGFQYTMNHEGLELASVERGALEVDHNSVGVRNGLLTMSWFNETAISTDEVLFTLVFSAQRQIQLSDALSINSSITRAEAYKGKAYDVHDIDLEFTAPIDSTPPSSVFELYQNKPNPFEDKTTIGFNLPNSGNVQFSVFDLTGKLIKQINTVYSKGYNEIILGKSEFNSGGIFYYQLESGTFSATKKMILIE